jgi:uncharacterized membrane protein YjjP (DUF1212 family)
MKKKFDVLKNKIDLEYSSLMQERNAILIALTGIPITMLNLSFSFFKFDMFQSMVIAFVSGLFIFYIKTLWDEKLHEKLKEMEKLIE